MSILIKNGHICNPATGTDAVMDLLLEDGRVAAMGEGLEIEAGIASSQACTGGETRVIDATSCYVFPGFVDLHVHFRDPGQTHKEDIATGSAAAARGGVTTVVAMPNTKPVVDEPSVVEYVHAKSAEVGLTNVLQCGCITKGMAGVELSEIEAMAKAGIPALSEDGKSVMDSALYRRAMKLAAELDIPVLAHCEDIILVDGGVINMREKPAELGVKGSSNAVENIIAARDIMLAEETGACLHLCHCSTKETVELVRDAKAKGIKVSGEVCPHHFTLTDADIVPGDGNYKMNPPLRTKADVDALKQGLADGIMEVISTDHAPHAPEEKGGDLNKCAFGIVGLETSAALTYTELVLGGYLSPYQMAEKMSYNPARILGIDRGDISPGKVADVVIFDPTAEYEIHASDFAGKSTNMPFEGRKVTGKVVTTILNGKVVYPT